MSSGWKTGSVGKQEVQRTAEVPHCRRQPFQVMSSLGSAAHSSLCHSARLSWQGLAARASGRSTRSNRDLDVGPVQVKLHAAGHLGVLVAEVAFLQLGTHGLQQVAVPAQQDGLGPGGRAECTTGGSWHRTEHVAACCVVRTDGETQAGRSRVHVAFHAGCLGCAGVLISFPTDSQDVRAPVVPVPLDGVDEGVGGGAAPLATSGTTAPLACTDARSTMLAKQHTLWPGG